MDIQDALKQEPQHIQDSPVVQAMLNLIQKQNEQIQTQTEQISKLNKTIDELKNEISRLNKTPKRPKFKPNKIEPRKRGKSSTPSSKNEKNICVPNKKREEIKVLAEGVPKNSRFKGYSKFKVQDLDIAVKDITYKLEVWITPEGKVIRGQLPQEVRGKHFGANLRALVINLYAQGMTQPAIHDFLKGVGIKISSGQISHIFLDEAEKFSEVSEAILEAGLNEAPYIRTDDTGARHNHKNAYCTHIGGEHFAYYKTAFSKSRANFLSILLQGKSAYRINDAMIWHLFQCGVKDDILNLFETHKGKKYASQQGLKRFFANLHLRGKKLQAQCTEAAAVGFIAEEILREGQVLLSDRAGQFAVFDHAGCWVHMERPLRKIISSSSSVQNEVEEVRNAIWQLYRKLKKAALTQTGRKEVEKKYDALLAMNSTSPAITAVLNGFRQFREEMLKALDHPGLPLHNNASEGDIREFVKRRKISGSTKSEKGRKFRDGLVTLKKTCFRLGLSFWEYSLQWFQGNPLDLAQLVRNRYQEAALP